jgi:hypothetical protein
MSFLKTAAVADLLGVSYYKIIELLRSRKIPAPQKDSSGDYVWLEGDIQAARAALAAGRNRKVVAHG